MRIITGKFRGRKLTVPENEVRPTLGRAKETLFNVIQFDIENRRVLDLFAGSGALGLEAISRGAVSVTFVDSDPKSISAIRQNCQTLGVTAEIIRSDCLRALGGGIRGKFDLIFLDPPFESEAYGELLSALENSGLLESGALVVCEHSKSRQIPPPQKIKLYKLKIVGNIGFSFYKFSE